MEYKIQAVKLAKELGGAKATAELGIPENTLYAWMKAARKGRLSFCCRMLKVTRQGFYKYLANKERPWKYQGLADAMRQIVSEDECNNTYGRTCMYQALLLKQPEGILMQADT